MPFAAKATATAGSPHPTVRRRPGSPILADALGDVRVEEREDPEIIEPTDAIVKLTATCIRGSDLWPYRGIEPADHTAA